MLRIASPNTENFSEAKIHEALEEGYKIMYSMSLLNITVKRAHSNRCSKDIVAACV